MPDAKPWNLVADIGGTNARFALHDHQHDELKEISVLSVRQHPDFIGALRYFITQIAQSGQWSAMPQSICLAVACPVDQDLIRFTNSHWGFSKKALSAELGHIPLDVINDFSAIAYSLLELQPDEWHQIGGGEPQPSKPVAILGAGTGLGVCTLVPVGHRFVVVDGEGGHIDFAPTNEQEIAILSVLQRRFGRVSIERLLSGAGIENIYRALCELESAAVIHHSAQQISAAALQGEDALATETLAVFCRVLGSSASNLALISGARGGVYIAGGIAPRIIDFIERSELRQRFDDKGRFKSYVENIPLRVLLKKHPGLYGAMQRVKRLSRDPNE